MSGIAGVIRFDRSVGATEMEAMLQAMARRGPDRRAHACRDGAGFAQALLATTPEALAECQPWRHSGSGCMVVSDSRLDNRVPLLRELGIARPADGVGDGELLHAAWRRWGEHCADRLRGDFAFAIWDPAGRELFLARDPMGVRPLAFHSSPGRMFVFGSTADVVAAQGEVPRTLDEGRIADALIGETQGIDQTCTFYAAIQRLPPAHWMRLRNGRLELRRYWRPIGEDRPTGLPRNETEWIEAQREQLDRAVRLRLRSHRPVGSMLSGGLDSSAVVALASAARTQEGRDPLPVFSATNSADPDCSETRAIRAVATHVHCAPTFIDLPEFERTDTRAHRFWEEAGEPFDGPMVLLAAMYEAAATRGVPSMLDGLPADNLYAYGRRAKYLFDQGHRRKAWQAAVTQWQLPWVRFPRLNAMRVMAGCIAPDSLHALRNRLAESREYRKLVQSSLIARDFARSTRLRDRYRRYRPTIGGSHQWHPSGEALSTLAAPYITGAIERYNRVASLYGIEPRPPYADRELIEFQAWMPLELRIRDGRLKWVLRQAMQDLLPMDVAWRRDKSHVGWRFTKHLLLRHCAAGIPKTPEQDTWLDARRLAEARRKPDDRAGRGLPAATMVLAWRNNRDRFPHPQAD